MIIRLSFFSQVIALFTLTLGLSFSPVFLGAADEPRETPSPEVQEEDSQAWWEQAKTWVEETRESFEDFDQSEIREEVRRRYEEAKEKGETAGRGMVEWAQDDFKKINSWEYRVVAISLLDPLAMEEVMNEMGAERWECISVTPLGTEARLFFKRRPVSYLRHLPVKDLVRFLQWPFGGGESAP